MKKTYLVMLAGAAVFLVLSFAMGIQTGHPIPAGDMAGEVILSSTQKTLGAGSIILSIPAIIGLMGKPKIALIVFIFLGLAFWGGNLWSLYNARPIYNANPWEALVAFSELVAFLRLATNQFKDV